MEISSDEVSSEVEVSSDEASSEIEASNDDEISSDIESSEVESSSDEEIWGSGASLGLEFTLSADGTYYSVTGIGRQADFEIVIPASYKGLPVMEIGDRAFESCYLMEVIIPDSVTSIGDGVFYQLAYLTEVVIPDSVISIEYYAFSSCDCLTEIIIPDSVTSIGNSAFEHCWRLTSITFKGTVEEWNAIKKGYRWNYEVPATEVVCSDGTVAL